MFVDEPFIYSSNKHLLRPTNVPGWALEMKTLSLPSRSSQSDYKGRETGIYTDNYNTT